MFLITEHWQKTTKPLLLAMPDATNLEYKFWKENGTVMDDYNMVT